MLWEAPTESWTRGCGGGPSPRRQLLCRCGLCPRSPCCVRCPGSWDDRLSLSSALMDCVWGTCFVIGKLRMISRSNHWAPAGAGRSSTRRNRGNGGERKPRTVLFTSQQIFWRSPKGACIFKISLAIFKVFNLSQQRCVADTHKLKLDCILLTEQH